MIALGIFLGLYVLWVFYLAVMSLWRAKRENVLGPLALIFGVPVLGVGAVLDFLVNTSIASVLFWELPREFLLTKRLQRHIKFSQDWRRTLARFICKNLLNPFDPTGDHCD
jgi:hypothetical protein